MQATPNNPAAAELTLLQFVALALPAVAILLQAVIQQHDQMDDYSSQSWTEIKLIQYSFYALVMSGLVFIYPIFIENSSIYVQIGILIAGGALLLLIPATWFGLRRGRYGTNKFETPEKEAKSKLKLYVPFMIGAAVIGLIARFLPTILGTFTTASIENSIPFINNVVVGAVIATSILLFLQLVEIYTKFKARDQAQQAWNETLIKNLEEIESLLESYSLEDDAGVRHYKYMLKKLNNTSEILGELIEDVPEGVDEDRLRRVQDLSNQLSLLQDLTGALISALEDAQAFDKRYQSLVSELQSTRMGIDAEAEDASAEINRLEDLKNSTEEKRERQLNQVEDLEADISETISQINSIIELLHD